MNIRRRTLLHSLWLSVLPIHAWGKSTPNQTTWLMPDENHRHVATWMAWLSENDCAILSPIFPLLLKTHQMIFVVPYAHE